MPKAEMARYALAVYDSKRKYNKRHQNTNGMKAIVNNVHVIGDYFFIDYSLQNKAKIAYYIEELRVKLTDKKETKATNSQAIEPVMVCSLNPVRKFKKDCCNVFVIEKLTFPDEKAAIGFIVAAKYLQGYVDGSCYRLNHRDNGDAFIPSTKRAIA